MISSTITALAIARSQDFPVPRLDNACSFVGIEREQTKPSPVPTQPPLQLDQAASGGTCHGFGAANDIHLGKDRFYVRFHCAFADK